MIGSEKWCRKLSRDGKKTLDRKWLPGELGPQIPVNAISAAIFRTNIMGLMILHRHESRIDGWYTIFRLTTRCQEYFCCFYQLGGQI